MSAHANTDANTCNFPGCERPVPRGSAPGRPPEYCDLPEHTRWRAWRERQRMQQGSAKHTDTQETSSEATVRSAVVLTSDNALAATPVSDARLRADDLLTRFAVQTEQLTATLEAARQAFGTMTDPASAEAQVEATRLEAARRVAEADGARLEAENRRRQAESERAKAQEAAESAIAAAGTAERMADEAVAAREAGLAERDSALAHAITLAMERDAAVAEGNAGLAEAEKRVREIERQSATVVEEERRRAQWALDEAHQQAATEQNRLRIALTEQSETRELAEHRAARAESAAEHAQARADDLAAERDRLRAEVERGRTDAERERSRLRAELDDQRAAAERSLAEARESATDRLAAAEETRAQITRRAERAERQLDEALKELRGWRAAAGGIGVDSPDTRTAVDAEADISGTAADHDRHGGGSTASGSSEEP